MSPAVSEILRYRHSDRHAVTLNNERNICVGIVKQNNLDNLIKSVNSKYVLFNKVESFLSVRKDLANH